MNIQQLEYITAVDRLRHFARAAEACGVSQPTLSMMIQKLEEELGVEIFDRKKSPIEPTTIGAKLITQAKVINYNIKQFKEIADASKEAIDGELNMAIIPTLAPYIIPNFFGEVQRNIPDLKVTIAEIRTAEIVEKIHSGELELAMVSTPLEEDGILELPLFYEKFVLYISPLYSELYDCEEIYYDQLDSSQMWFLQEGHCFRNQMLTICHQSNVLNQVYEAGSIETLIRIVDLNGGFTLIPELHIEELTPQQRSSIRYFSGEEPRREVSFIFGLNFVKEKLINKLVDGVKSFIPREMLDERLSRFRVKL